MDEPRKRNATPADLQKRTAGIVDRVILPENEVLTGEVLEVSRRGDTTWLTVRDDQHVSVEVRCDVQPPPELQRGHCVDLDGRPTLVVQHVPVGIQMVWRASSFRDRGESPRFKAARDFAFERASRLPRDRPQLKPGDRVGKVWVVTATEGKAWQDVKAAAERHFPWMCGRLHQYDCWNIRDARKLKATLGSLLERVLYWDVVIVTRGGGDRIDLDVFEEPAVLDAIADLTERCVTILAVGHADDHLLTSSVATETAETPTAAVSIIARKTAKPRLTATPEWTPRRGRRRAPGTAAIPFVLAVGMVLGWWVRGWFIPSSVASIQHAEEPLQSRPSPSSKKHEAPARQHRTKGRAGSGGR